MGRSFLYGGCVEQQGKHRPGGIKAYTSKVQEKGRHLEGTSGAKRADLLRAKKLSLKKLTQGKKPRSLGEIT